MCRPRALLRVVAAALTTAALVSAQSAALVESSTTAHARCLEHGELIHAEQTKDASGSTNSVTSPPALEHEHCTLGTVLTSASPESPSAAPGLATPAGVLVTPQRPAHFFVAGWRLAPKTSPPLTV